MASVSTGSRGHGIQYIGWGIYRLYWKIEMKYAGSRLLYHKHFSRDTDRKGAERFAKKWKVPLPDESRG